MLKNNTTSSQVRDRAGRLIPISVNYFPHRRCNYSCGFCFHTNLSSTRLTLEKAKEGLRLLAAAGMKKLNISGGEPFLEPKFIGEIFKFCKEELKLEGTGVICNGSKVTEQWLNLYGDYLDFMGVSCDSFDEETNLKIGRSEGGGRTMHWRKVLTVAEWCRDRPRPIKFKMNTVVNAYNWEEDMSHALDHIQPERWKVFQVLLLEGENVGPDAIRNAEELVVTFSQFQFFLKQHEKHNPVAEDNDAMESSYLLLDEEMRFLNCKGGTKIPGMSIFAVGVDQALQEAGWEPETFVERGGIYDWSKAPSETDPGTLDW
ncbi:hypothetical protein OF83DRAFT_1140203 [Amylostereum chailletii]|nr:hypothetical protein OF83DRAFT_1140203 [Amylostereum chailletii]